MVVRESANGWRNETRASMKKRVIVILGPRVNYSWIAWQRLWSKSWKVIGFEEGKSSGWKGSLGLIMTRWWEGYCSANGRIVDGVRVSINVMKFVSRKNIGGADWSSSWIVVRRVVILNRGRNYFDRNREKLNYRAEEFGGKEGSGRKGYRLIMTYDIRIMQMACQ